MLIGAALPVSAQEIINITDYAEGSTEAGDSAEPSLPAVPPAEEPSAASPTQAQPPPTEPEDIPPEEYTNPPLGFSGEEELDEVALIAEMEAWLNGLVTRAGQIALFRAAPGDTGTVVHSTISIRPYDVTVPGVGRAYGSVIWRMKINSEDAFCLQIWKLAGGTYTAGEATSGNGQTAQYVANYMASGKSKEEYVAAQVLVWESLYGDIGIFNQSIRGTSFESAYNSLKSKSAPVSDLIYWTSNTGGDRRSPPLPPASPPMSPILPTRPMNPIRETTPTLTPRLQPIPPPARKSAPVPNMNIRTASGKSP